MPRRAALHLLTCALALATAVALLGPAAVVDEAPVAARTAGNTEAVVRSFYDAVNYALRSGDASALEAATDPALVLRVPPLGVTADRAGLVRYLVAVHATVPG